MRNQESKPDTWKAMVKDRLNTLFERRWSLAQGFDEITPGYNPAEAIQQDFESLAQEVGVSPAALELWHDPTDALVRARLPDLTPIETQFAVLDRELAEELRQAGLLG